MKNYGFVRIGTAVPIVEVANCKYNVENIYSLIKEAEKKHISILNFPELCITGYTCGDLFHQTTLIKESENQIYRLLELTKDIEMLITIGAPIMVKGKLYNCALVIYKGKILNIYSKSYIPNKNEFYEKRWFYEGNDYDVIHINYCNQYAVISNNVLMQHKYINDLVIGVEICEDLWSPIPPSTYQALAGASVILNLSASNDLIGKSEYRKEIVKSQSSKNSCAYIYTSAGFGESSTDLVFGGHCLIYENGTLLKENSKYNLNNQLMYEDIDIEKILANRIRSTSFYDCSHINNKEFEYVVFETEINNNVIEREIDAYPFIPKDTKTINERCNEIFNIQIMGLAKRIKHINAKSMVIGISGGLDSTLALLVCAKTCDLLGMDRKSIKAVTMPGFGTTDRTYNNAVNMIKSLGATFREVSIREAVIGHFNDINHDINNKNVVYENSQARERTQILMDIANQESGLVIGTGDLSELVLGWATYNGDQMSMYGVNASIPKTLIKYVVEWIAEYEFKDSIRDILLDVVNTPVSPELLPPDENGKIAQKTEELVGPYELHDFFIYNVLRFGYEPEKIYYICCKAFKDKYSNKTVLKWLKNFYYRFIAQQYKRTCMPDGPKVGTISLSPRGDLRMPTDASSKIWLDQLDKITF